MNRQERRSAAAQNRKVSSMHEEKLRRGANEIQIAHSPDGKQIAVITDEHTYAWNLAKIPGIVDALRAHANGASLPGADVLVFSYEDRVCLSDKPPKRSYQSVEGQAALIIDQKNWTYTMPKHGARLLANNLEAVLRQIEQ
jgi:hypothetical protein